MTISAARIVREVDEPVPLPTGRGWTALRQIRVLAPPDLRDAFTGLRRRDELVALRRDLAQRLWDASISGDLSGERPLARLHHESVWTGTDEFAPPDLLWLADVLDFLVAMMGPEDAVEFEEGS